MINSFSDTESESAASDSPPSSFPPGLGRKGFLFARSIGTVTGVLEAVVDVDGIIVADLPADSRRYLSSAELLVLESGFVLFGGIDAKKFALIFGNLDGRDASFRLCEALTCLLSLMSSLEACKTFYAFLHRRWLTGLRLDLAWVLQGPAKGVDGMLPEKLRFLQSRLGDLLVEVQRPEFCTCGSGLPGDHAAALAGCPGVISFNELDLQSGCNNGFLIRERALGLVERITGESRIVLCFLRDLLRGVTGKGPRLVAGAAARSCLFALSVPSLRCAGSYALQAEGDCPGSPE